MHKLTVTAVQFPVDELKRIACHFFDPAYASVLIVTPAEAGLSGSQTYILKHPETGRKYVLKKLPSNLSVDQIRWTQKLADFARCNGHALLPVALDHCARSTQVSDAPSKIVSHSDGTMWQCLVYIEGRPCKTPSTYHVSLAIEVLADFHQKTSVFQMPPQRSLSGWQRRVLQLQELLESRRSPLVNSINTTAVLAELHVLHKEFSRLICAVRTPQIIQHTLSYTMGNVHQPTLRDCRWNHVLFSDSSDCVTGMIDIDAAGWDDPAVDLSRLLGSWQLENQESEDVLFDLWPDAFRQYETSVAAGSDFPTRVQVLHDTAILCGIHRWFTWIFAEKRYFPNMKEVLQRVTLLFHATPAAIRRLDRLPPRRDSN